MESWDTQALASELQVLKFWGLPAKFEAQLKLQYTAAGQLAAEGAGIQVVPTRVAGADDSTSWELHL